MDMPLENQERNLSYTLCINRNREQQQRLMQRGPPQYKQGQKKGSQV